MRTTMISLVIFLLLAFAAPFFFGPGGKPMLSMDKIKGPALPDLSGATQAIKDSVGGLTGAPPSAPGGSTPGAPAAPPEAVADQVYKWRDASGQMHFGNTPPPGVKAERVRLDPKANVLSTVQLPSASGGGGGGAPPSGTVSAAAALGGKGVEGFVAPDPAKGRTPQNIQQTVDAARNMQGLMDARKAAQDAASEGR